MRSKWLWAVLTLVAVLGITTAASATTRGLITGGMIKPHSITSKHLVNHTIQAHDLSKKLVTSLRGARGATGPTGPAGPQGAPGISGHAIVTGKYQVVMGEEKTVTVTAPAGKVVLGGGVSSATPGAIVVEESYPSTAATWTVTVYAWPSDPYFEGTAINFTAYAIVGTLS